MMKFVSTLVLLSMAVSVQARPSTNNDFIRVDQFGYLPNSSKVAVIANPITGYDSALSFAPSTGTGQYQLRRWSDDTPVFTGTLTPWNSGATDATSGDQAWWFDFSSWTQPGSYYVYDVGNNARSFKVNIGPNVYADELRAALRMFFYQRCNTVKSAQYTGANWADEASFIKANQDTQARPESDQTNTSATRDLSGGWWDAGDLNKYAGNSSDALNLLLMAYTENSSVFGDNNNIPESGNGIPDILDEVKWGMDWLKKMQLSWDGSVRRKVGTLQSDSASSLPPSTDTRPRYYAAATSSSTIAAAGAFAHASVVFRNVSGYTAYADDLKARAIQAFTHFQTHPVVVATGSLLSGGNTDKSIPEQNQLAVYAAVYLYQATGDVTYKNYVETNYSLVSSYLKGGTPSRPWFITSMMDFTRMPSVTPAVTAQIIADYKSGLTWNDQYRWTTKDPYRSFMVSYTYDWASLTARASMGALNSEVIFNGVDSPRNADYYKRSEESLHYFNGVNPFNMVYLTNMYAYGVGKSVDEIFHLWYADATPWDNARTSSKGGPAPGYLTGGPNLKYAPADPNTIPPSPPSGQPAQKSYKSWNGVAPNAWKEASYTVTEPSIQYQGMLIWFLSKYATTTTATLPMPVTGPVGNVSQ